LNFGKVIKMGEFKIKAYPTTLIYNRGILKFSEAGYTTTAGLLARLNLL